MSLFRDRGMNYIVGKDWRDLFDVVIVQADKPGFFNDRRKWVPGSAVNNSADVGSVIRLTFRHNTKHPVDFSFHTLKQDIEGVFVCVFVSLGHSDELLIKECCYGTEFTTWRRGRFINRYCVSFGLNLKRADSSCLFSQCHSCPEHSQVWQCSNRDLSWICVCVFYCVYFFVSRETCMSSWDSLAGGALRFYISETTSTVTLLWAIHAYPHKQTVLVHILELDMKGEKYFLPNASEFPCLYYITLYHIYCICAVCWIKEKKQNMSIQNWHSRGHG